MPRVKRWRPRPITAGWAACRTKRCGGASNVRTALDAARVNQHVRTLDASSHRFVRQAAQPAVIGHGRHRGTRGLSQQRIERFADVIDMDIALGHQQARGSE